MATAEIYPFYLVVLTRLPLSRFGRRNGHWVGNAVREARVSPVMLHEKMFLALGKDALPFPNHLHAGWAAVTSHCLRNTHGGPSK
jgi:hypothetical protein